MMKRYIIIITLFLLAGFFNPAFAEDRNFEVTINKNRVALGSSAQLSLNFHGTQSVHAPELPDIEGFDWRYLGPSTRMSIVNGKITTSVTHIYNLAALKVGTHKIPSISVKYKGQTYTSDPITIEVIRGAVDQFPTPQGRESLSDIQGLGDRLFLIMRVGKKRAYVNEIIPVSIKLYVNKLSIRDIQYPEFPHEGFLVDEFLTPKQYRKVLNGVLYDVIEFNTNIFGMRPGELILGPTILKCNLVQKKSRRRRTSLFDDDFFGSDIFDGFFGRHESRPLSLESIAFPIKIMALPEENKPADFSGALGNYRFNLDASPKEVKVGDPITLKMTVSGEGNLKTVKPIELNLKDDFKVYEPEIKQDELSKIFEQVIIPKNKNINKIPAVSFSFFDTESGEYRRVVKGPIPIKVSPLPKGEELKVFEVPEDITGIIRRKEILGRDIIYIKDNPGKLNKKGLFLYKNKLFIAVLFIPLLAVVSVLILQGRKERLETDIRYARRLRAPRKARKNLAVVRRLLASGEPDEFFEVVFKTLQEYLGDKFHLPTAGITADVLEDPMFRDMDKGIIDSLKECFDICDRARYAPSSITKEEMSATFKLLQENIDRLERIKV